MKFLFDGRNRLFFLSYVSLVLIVSVSLVSVKEQSLAGVIIQKVKSPFMVRTVSNVSLMPVLASTTDFPILTAQSVIAVDLDSGVTLYEKNPDNKLLPASTTKIMTALVALDHYPKEYVLEVGNVSVIGQKMGLISGEKITVENLLYGLLVFSANDAAEVLAASYPGGRQLFIEAMNLKAQELYLTKTHFENPTGLDSANHYSTARDMVRLAEVAMRDPFFAQIVATSEKTVTSVDGQFVHRLRNINELLRTVEGVKGVKTGWTANARENLVTYIKRDGRSILIGILGSQDRFGETKELIDWVFENYSWESVRYSP